MAWVRTREQEWACRTAEPTVHHGPRMGGTPCEYDAGHRTVGSTLTGGAAGAITHHGPF